MQLSRVLAKAGSKKKRRRSKENDESPAHVEDEHHDDHFAIENDAYDHQDGDLPLEVLENEAENTIFQAVRSSQGCTAQLLILQKALVMIAESLPNLMVASLKKKYISSHAYMYTRARTRILVYDTIEKIYILVRYLRKKKKKNIFCVHAFIFFL
jgi:hypothetical protein